MSVQSISFIPFDRSEIKFGMLTDMERGVLLSVSHVLIPSGWALALQLFGPKFFGPFGLEVVARLTWITGKVWRCTELFECNHRYNDFILRFSIPPRKQYAIFRTLCCKSALVNQQNHWYLPRTSLDDKVDIPSDTSFSISSSPRRWIFKLPLGYFRHFTLLWWTLLAYFSPYCP